MKTVIGLLLFLLAFGLFWPASHFDFIVFDDDIFISENPHVRSGLTWSSVLWALSADLVFDSINADFWVPVTFLSHILTAEIFGMNPSAHHFVNIILHALNTVLLFWVLRRMSRDLWPSAFVAVLFAIHPLHVESVAWVTERKDVLSTMFFLLTIGAYIRYTERPNSSRYVLVAILFTLGLMSKPMLVTLPMVLLLLDYWPLERFTLPGLRGPHGREIIWKLFREKIPLLSLSIGFSMITYLIHKGVTMASWDSIPIWDRMANALVSYVGYIYKMIWPTNLAVFYLHPGDSLPIWQVAGASLFLFIMSILVLWMIESRPYLVVGWLWYLGTLVPVIGLLQVGAQGMADRYAYITLIGLFIMIGWGGQDLSERWQHRKILLTISTAIIFPALIICTSMQLRYWRNSITLFEHALRVADENFLVHHNLGLGYMRSGDLDRAVQQFQATLRLKPDSFEAYNQLGIAHFKQNKSEEARILFLNALQINPNYNEAQNNLGMVVAEQGNVEESMNYFTRALSGDPDSPMIHNNFGMALFNQGRYSEAMGHFSQAVQLDPNSAMMRNNFGKALYAQGKLKEALSHYARAIQINPGFDEAHYNMGFVHMEQGFLKEATHELQIAVKLKPQSRQYRTDLGESYRRNGQVGQAILQFKKLLESNTDDTTAHTNLGLAYADQRRMPAAIFEYKRALEIDPDFVDAHFNLALVYTALGRTDEAIQEYQTALRIQPAYTNAYNNLANIFVNQGKYQDAIRQFQHALEYNPNDETLHYNLGIIYKRLGKTKEARDHFQQALRIKPDFNPARQALVLLE